ncbi:hypothetical protein [Idiomarina abyssalis]|uniref:hypothetical protein n=1 Tax=Idiomarina abyssalis TaxID=86102 RepID=UPI003A93C569
MNRIKIELSQSTMYWYELLVSKFQEFDTPKLIKDDLKKQKEELNKNFEKRFVYFICSRKKIRFNTTKKTKKVWFKDKVRIPLVVGEEKKKRSIDVTFIDRSTGEFSNPKIDLYDNFITIHDLQGNKESYPIHNFLEKVGIDIGFPTKVEYVGYTMNPHTRPTNGAHTGLSDVLYKTANDDVDILLYFNIFRTICITNTNGLDVPIDNSIAKWLSANDEGFSIEKSFIFYFDSENQFRNKESESQELTNLLNKFKKQNKIDNVQFYYEFARDTEYWEFTSTKCQPKRSLRFKVELNGKKWQIT